MSFGNLFIIGFDSLVLTKNLEEDLLKLQPAGVILYDCNIDSHDQVKKLIKDLRKLLGDDLLVSVDQEGGKVQRLRKICTDLPSLNSLGKAAEINAAYLKTHSSALAKELSTLGFNLVYAPCADLNTNPENPIIGSRSLGSDPEVVSEQLVKIHNTYRENRLLSCAKHFPGHGDAGVDSHLNLPLVKRTAAENEFHLQPFKALVKNDIEMIMIAHLVVNEGLPASINPKTIKSLREKLGFGKLIISDEITMKALSQFGDYNKIAELLIKAGNNLIIWNTNLDDALRTADYLNLLADADLKQAYEESSKIISSLKKSLEPIPKSGPSSRHPDRSKEYRESSLLEIAKLGIEFQTERHKEFKFGSNTLVIINDHPKLDKKLIEKTFPENDILTLSEAKNIQTAILLEFQISNSDLESVYKQVSREKLLHVSTDICHKNADISLNGASLSHYVALESTLS